MILFDLDAARDHLRLGPDDASESELLAMVEGASAAVMNYIQGPGVDGFTDSAGDIFEDTAGNPLYVPPAIVSAGKLMLGYLWRNRDENLDGAFERGYLPAPVCALLTPYRQPSLA
jgi:hypothetical protein